MAAAFLKAATEPPDESNLRYEGWRVVIGSSIGVLVSFSSLLLYAFAVLLKPLAEEFVWSREEVSSMFGLAAATAAVSSPFIGFLLDRFGPRRVIVPCLTVFGGGFIALSMASALWHFYAVFLAFGLVANGTAQMAYTSTVASWFDRRRGTAFALMHSGGAVGAMLVPPVVDVLTRSFGWRWACTTLGTTVLSVGLPTVALLIRNRPSVLPRVGDPEVIGSSFRDGLHSRVLWTLMIVLAAVSVAKTGAVAHLAAMFTDRGMSSSRAAVAASAVGAASLVGRLLSGWLLDRLPASRVSFALLVVASLGLFTLAEAETFAGGMTAVVLLGFGVGGQANVTPYLMARCFGLRAFSTLYGLSWMAHALAGAGGPIVMGRAFDDSGSYTTVLLGFGVAMLAASGLMLSISAADSAAMNSAESPDGPPVRRPRLLTQ
jgi:sugar phosphate permease